MQVSMAFRHFEERLTLAELDPAWLDEPGNAVLRSSKIVERRMVMETLPTLPATTDNGMDTPAAVPPKIRMWQYLCAVAGHDISLCTQVWLHLALRF
jgi:hypothetical protein